ncbi:MAG: potassium channel family protein [Puniceicoccaceae bacterium]
MKFLVSQFAYFVRDPQARRNLGAFRKYLYFLLGVIVLYSVLFHVVMSWEGQDHSWLTGFYWTLTVMSTLGFGDITFESDVGRLFSVLVLSSGVLLLLIMLPFAFIRFFYAPWLEAQLRARVPRSLSADIEGHVIICRQDWITNGLVRKLSLSGIPYVILEEDSSAASEKHQSGVPVVFGEVDDPRTYEAVNIRKARLLVANAEDATNTNILLTVRSINSTLPIIALAEDDDSIDIFTLSGATYVLPLKTRLGEQLATRVSAGVGVAQEVGRFKDLVIAEFLVHGTPLAGVPLREAGLREKTGMNVVGLWEAGRFHAVDPDKPLDETSVPVAVGREDQIERLNALLGGDSGKRHAVLVIGGGKVGRSTALALRKRGVHVRILDRDPSLREELAPYCHEVIIGNASDRTTLAKAGIDVVGSVALTTNDDAQNIHLAVYFRRLKPQLGIVSRITRERNIDAIYRAGADFVLSYASLGCEFINAYLLHREPVMVGEGADFFSVGLPKALAGKTLGESEIGARTGLVVVAVEENGEARTNPPASTRLGEGAKLLILGTNEQREKFDREFRGRE